LIPRFLSAATALPRASSAAFSLRRALLALAERLLERALQELVDALQDRRERPAREAPVLLVHDAERDEVRRLELERPVLLARARLLLGEAAVHADHLERLLLEVVGLLGVERQDLVRRPRARAPGSPAPTRPSASRGAVLRWWPFGVQ
jgi:hypothetical protein